MVRVVGRRVPAAKDASDGAGELLRREPELSEPTLRYQLVDGDLERECDTLSFSGHLAKVITMESLPKGETETEILSQPLFVPSLYWLVIDYVHEPQGHATRGLLGRSNRLASASNARGFTTMSDPGTAENSAQLEAGLRQIERVGSHVFKAGVSIVLLHPTLEGVREAAQDAMNKFTALPGVKVIDEHVGLWTRFVELSPFSGRTNRHVFKTFEEVGDAPADTDTKVLGRKLALQLQNWVGETPYGKVLDRPTTIDLSSRLVYFEASGVKDFEDFKPVAMLLVADLMWRRFKANRGKPKLAVIEEAGVTLKIPEAAAVIEEFGRLARTYNGGLWLVSQFLEDFTHSSAARVLNNLTLHFLLPVPGEEGLVQQTLGLSDRAMEAFRSVGGKRGEYRELLAWLRQEDRIVGDVLVNRPDPLELWAYTSHAPEVAVRDAAITEEGDPLRAIQKLAKTPAFLAASLSIRVFEGLVAAGWSAYLGQAKVIPVRFTVSCLLNTECRGAFWEGWRPHYPVYLPFLSVLPLLVGVVILMRLEHPKGKEKPPSVRRRATKQDLLTSGANVVKTPSRTAATWAICPRVRCCGSPSGCASRTRWSSAAPAPAKLLATPRPTCCWTPRIGGARW